ncbi:MAG: anaerobic sulfatase maturase AslB [Alphaproteobacteria bacterium]|nr:MAG: anaerobic sulfatase maturase AslB [Alphaproteobacteria bacterium]
MRANLPFHLMAKPVGPLCNLRCRYCFYLEKEALFPPRTTRCMDDSTLEEFVRQYIESQPGTQVDFAWQGGEPTLLGVEYFRKAVDLQRRYANGRTIRNALQTNGTLLDDEWGAFLSDNDFLVGVSLDGPRALHDRSRIDPHGRGSWTATMRGVAVLRRHKVEFNTLTCVSRANAGEPLEVYRFLLDAGARHLQFIPVVERSPATAERERGLSLGAPSLAASCTARATNWSIDGAGWGDFLIAIFDRWVRRDAGNVQVQQFDDALGRWLGLPGGVCVHSETCGRALAIEHDGSVYACDHYVYPEYRLGNVRETGLPRLVDDPRQIAFGLAKRDRLPDRCRSCPVRFACHGGCPKHRFGTGPGGEPGSNHLCEGYRAFFTHVDPYMRLMATLYRRGQPPGLIRSILATSRRR